MIDFDEIIDRKNTDSIKHDFAAEFGAFDDEIPLWVADMDFKAPEEVLRAMEQRVEHGIFGYSEVKGDYFEAVAGWFSRRYGFLPKEEWLIKSPGIVFALNHAVRAFTEQGDAVLIQQPVYRPFSQTILGNNRKLVSSDLVCTNGRYKIDFADFEQKIITHHVKLFILCSPHNPVGRVWSKEELTRLGTICLKHKVTVVADEIHCDFTCEGFYHTVFAGISEEFADNCIVCTSPSKTFNLAGLQVSNLFVPNPRLRELLKEQFQITGYDELNTFGLIACKAAYTYGEKWLTELKQYLKGNYDFVKSYLGEAVPQIVVADLEGTYLLWLDFSRLKMEKEELSHMLHKKAKIWLDQGSKFGEESGQFYRLNMACPRSVLEKAVKQLASAVSTISTRADGS